MYLQPPVVQSYSDRLHREGVGGGGGGMEGLWGILKSKYFECTSSYVISVLLNSFGLYIWWFWFYLLVNRKA